MHTPMYVIYTDVFKERQQKYICTCAWLMCGFKVLWELPIEQLWYEATFYIIWFCMHDVSAIAFSITSLTTYIHMYVYYISVYCGGLTFFVKP